MSQDGTAAPFGEMSLSMFFEAMAAAARAREAQAAAALPEAQAQQWDVNTVRHMRTIDAAIQHVKEIDPETSLTKSALRRLVVSGTIPHTRIGNKYLVCLETLDDFLKGQTAEKPPDSTKTGGIRRLEARI